MIILSQKENKILNFGEHDVMEVKKYTYTSYEDPEENHDEWRFDIILTGWEESITFGVYKNQENAKAVWEAILNALEDGDEVFEMPIEKDSSNA